MTGRSAFAMTAALLVGIAITKVGPCSASDCNPTQLCPSNPCTIVGVHHLTPDCSLDFGDTDVTIAPNAALIWPTTGCFAAVGINARSLTVRGSIDAGAIPIEINTTGAFTTQRSPGRGEITAHASASELACDVAAIGIFAGGDVTLAGGEISAKGGGAFIEIDGGNFVVGSELAVHSLDPEFGGSVDLFASGAVTTTKPITAKGEGITNSAGIDIEGTDVVIKSKLRVFGQVNSAIEVDGDNVEFDAPVLCQGGNCGVDVSGTTSIAVNSDLLARPAAPYPYTSVTLNTGDSGSISVAGKIDVSGSRIGGDIEIGDSFAPACSVNVNGSLLARNGRNSITYIDQLNLSGARLDAGNGGNQISCRCIDTNNDGQCDGGCVSPPSGLSQAAMRPAAAVSPMSMPACGM